MSGFIPCVRPVVGDEECAAVDRVLRSGQLAQGPEVAQFEREFAAHFALGRACVAVSSGTSGLHVGLLASGVRPGDEVIVPSFTFAGTANAVALAGARPVFADISARDFCLDASAVEDVVTDRTVGIMPVHLYGHPADLPSLQAVADRHGLQVFEDAAQAHGASLHGVPVGASGTFGVFSLYPTKNMTSGEGGMVAVGDPEVERLLRIYRNQGMERRYENEVVGLNARMSDIHAAIGRVQLTRVAAWTRRRQDNAARLDAELQRRHGPGRGGGGRARLPPVHRAGARGPGRVRRRARAGARHRHRDLLPGPRAPPGAVPGRHRPAGDRTRRA